MLVSSVEGAAILGAVLEVLRLSTQILHGPASLLLGVDHRETLKGAHVRPVIER